MTSADAWIQALQRRLLVLAPHRRRPPGELPPGWQQWFDSMHQRPGRVTGAPADALVSVLAARPVAGPPRRAGELGRWQAFLALWRQQWHPAEPEDRGVRWLAGSISAVIHLVLAAILLWLMYVSLFEAAHAPPKGEELVVQIEYVGEGTPDQPGGGEESAPARPVVDAAPSPMPANTSPAPTGAPPAPAAAAEAPASVEPRPSAQTLPPAVTMPDLQVAALPVVEREVSISPPAPDVQPLVVSEPAPAPDPVFVLPPTTPRIDAPAAAMPSLEPAAPSMQVVDIPRVPRPSAERLPVQAPDAPVLQARAPEVEEREVPAPLRRPAPQAIREPEVAAPQLQAQVPQVRERDIPSVPRPEPVASATAEPAPAEVTPATTPPDQTVANAPASTESPAAPPAAAEPETPLANAGPEDLPAPGGWSTPERADDWGAAQQEQPGAQRGEPPGLYNSDGSVRLADTPGSASPGQPPGTITEEIADLDRAGTWLRRAPTDYEPTTFDKYWRPNETLLEEWVRRSVTTIRIPIPGTSKHIVCQTVLLVVGGGCGIEDPNLNEQPATARPPPDIPFKPELQEGNGSLPPGAQAEG
jgi:hypothetical protein